MQVPCRAVSFFVHRDGIVSLSCLCGMSMPRSARLPSPFFKTQTRSSTCSVRGVVMPWSHILLTALHFRTAWSTRRLWCGSHLSCTEGTVRFSSTQNLAPICNIISDTCNATPPNTDAAVFLTSFSQVVRPSSSPRMSYFTKPDTMTHRSFHGL